jgi:hypothetical protein
LELRLSRRFLLRSKLKMVKTELTGSKLIANILPALRLLGTQILDFVAPFSIFLGHVNLKMFFFFFLRF